MVAATLITAQDSPDAQSPGSGSGSGFGDSGFGDELDAFLRGMQKLVRGAAPGSVSGDQARTIVASFAEIERAAASGVALFTPRVVETGSFAKDGHASAQDWLGSLAGTSAAKAKALAQLRAAQASSPTRASPTRQLAVGSRLSPRLGRRRARSRRSSSAPSARRTTRPSELRKIAFISTSGRLRTRSTAAVRCQ